MEVFIFSRSAYVGRKGRKAGYWIQRSECRAKLRCIFFEGRNGAFFVLRHMGLEVGERFRMGDKIEKMISMCQGALKVSTRAG